MAMVVVFVMVAMVSSSGHGDDGATGASTQFSLRVKYEPAVVLKRCVCLVPWGSW